MNWDVGQTVLGQYQIKQVFTRGGMGLVYQVHHLGWGVDLALKRPRDDFGTASETFSEFEQEIETWAELGLHPNVATCHYSRHIEGMPCVFAEFVDGGSLREWIVSRRLYRGGEEAAISRILLIAAHFAWGLVWAHRHGLVHQDVKPGNVLMTADGTPKVTDFGLARSLAVVGKAGQKSTNPTVTHAGWTPPYGSPEQAQGLRLTRATDTWSWAVSVMEMFMGGIHWHSGPVAAESLKVYDQQGRRTHEMPEMPRDLVDLLSRCLNRDPARRLDSCGQIADTLMQIHKKLFGESCDVLEPDTEFFAADALNNRGVSLMDVGRNAEAMDRFQKALSVDTHHPEAVCNLVLALIRGGKMTARDGLRQLEVVLFNDESDFEVLKLLGLTLLELGETERASHVLVAAGKRALSLKAAQEIEALLPKTSESPNVNASPAQRNRYFLAQPKSGAEYIAEATRFKRLLTKAELAMGEARQADARRYLQMAREIPGFKRNHKFATLTKKLQQ